MLEMKPFVESLSLVSGALLVAGLSVGAVWLLSSVWPTSLRELWVVVVPFTFAYCLYRIPVWLGSDPSEYDAWAILFVGTWFLAGFFPSAVLVLVLRKRHAN
jgi:hypothetical protein